MISPRAIIISLILFYGLCGYAGDVKPMAQTPLSIKLVVSDSLQNLLEAEKNPDVLMLLNNAAVAEDTILSKITSAATQTTLFRAVSFLRTSQQRSIVDDGASHLSTDSLQDAMATINDNFDDKPLFAFIEKAIAFIVNTIAAKGRTDVSYQWLIKFSDQHVWTAKIKPISVNYLVFNRIAFLIKVKNIRNIIYLFDDDNGQI